MATKRSEAWSPADNGTVSRRRGRRLKSATKATPSAKVSRFDVIEWLQAMTTSPRHRPESEIFRLSEFWTVEMEAQVDDRMSTANALRLVTGLPTFSREAMVDYVAAEHLRQANQNVQLEIMRRREAWYKSDTEKWKKRFTEEPTTAEDAEEFAAEVNQVLDKIVSVVAKRCSGVCVWYTSGPKGIYRAEGVCTLPGRETHHLSEVKPAEESSIAGQIMSLSILINSYKWGNPKENEPADDMESDNSYEAPVVVDTVDMIDVGEGDIGEDSAKHEGQEDTRMSTETQTNTGMAEIDSTSHDTSRADTKNGVVSAQATSTAMESGSKERTNISMNHNLTVEEGSTREGRRKFKPTEKYRYWVGTRSNGNTADADR
ncbi:unnamed protein product [Peniophora sp. CBMAI 1063]|nr:unnamed protein product [Peniophora sp. CBMAI 1063]